jgi:acetyl esterase/lipase
VRVHRFAPAVVVVAVLLPACASDPAPASRPAPTLASSGPIPSPIPYEDLGRAYQDISYATISPAQTLDLAIPRGSGPFPLIVFVHGGAFVAGDKSTPVFAPYLPVVMEGGFAVASVNYRLAPEATFPAPIQDLKAAIRWLRANAVELGLDPDRFAAWGESAGGYLVSMLGTTAGVTRFDDPALGNPEVSSEVQAIVDWYGPVGFLAMDEQLGEVAACDGTWRSHGAASSGESMLLGAPLRSVPGLVHEADPTTYLIAGRPVPPFLIQHGDRDCVVPARQSVDLARALRRIGGSVELRIVEGFGHYEDFDLEGQVPVVLDFLGRTLSSTVE